MAAALPARRALQVLDRPIADLESLIRAGAARHRLCLHLLSLGTAAFIASWHWSANQADLLVSNLSQLLPPSSTAAS